VLSGRNNTVESGSVEDILAAESRARRPFGDTAPRDVTRPELVAYALDIIRREGPQSTNALLDRAFPALSPDDRAALRQRLPKWLMAECRHLDPPLSMRRHRSLAGGERRDNLLGFWPVALPLQDRSRAGIETAEVMAAIAQLQRTLDNIRVTAPPPPAMDNMAVLNAITELSYEVSRVQATVNVLSQWLNGLKDGVAYLHEKLTWNGER
jgi:hypothetical protein